MNTETQAPLFRKFKPESIPTKGNGRPANSSALNLAIRSLEPGEAIEITVSPTFESMKKATGYLVVFARRAHGKGNVTSRQSADGKTLTLYRLK